MKCLSKPLILALIAFAIQGLCNGKSSEPHSESKDVIFVESHKEELHSYYISMLLWYTFLGSLSIAFCYLKIRLREIEQADDSTEI